MLRTVLAAAVAVLGVSGAFAQVDWGKPVLVDDFERGALGDANWEVPAGACEIRDGKLVATDKGNFYLFYKGKLACNMAIEFDGMIPDTTSASDLTAVLSANEFEPAIRHYQGAVGTRGNKYTAIHRGKVRKEGDELVARSPLTLKPGQWVHIRAERQDEFVRLFVDGEKVLEFRDALAFAPASHNRIGLYTYGANTHFDNVKIYGLPVSEQYRKDAAVKWDRVYDRFNRFCLANFGAEKEPLVYELFGRELKFLDDGSWRHVSRNSATIAWETNLPAKSYVEYGETLRYGLRTPDEERPFYLHIHHLKGLDTGKTYHYRVVSTDERGNRITGPDATLETREAANTVCVPDDMGEPPYTLDKAGATYVLTRDVVADSTAFIIAAPNVTLDLNGHTLTWNEKYGSAEAVPSAKNIRRAFHGFTGAPGIVGDRRSVGARILNGFIVQGRGGSGNVCDPLLGVRAKEIAGVALDYYGYQMNGFIWAGSVEDLHHNVVKDKGTELVDRHWAVRAVTGCKKIHHNLIKRCRQRGISQGDEVTHNEVYQDSYATNAFGASGQKIEGNRILGGGVHVCAISWANGMQALGNLVHLQAQKSEDARWTEYGSGQGSSCNGIRLTQYGGGNDETNPLYLNNLYANNVIVVNTREGGGARGVQFSSHLQTKNLVCRDTTIKVV
ncbi:MAG TPA: family 16 glycoside hydrolase, partial [Planctomycetota bacterium]|nr:family 16 glycoside hydrolase [Planctomycetota bacterium]